jgi:hypothetical protein
MNAAVRNFIYFPVTKIILKRNDEAQTGSSSIGLLLVPGKNLALFLNIKQGQALAKQLFLFSAFYNFLPYCLS